MNNSEIMQGKQKEGTLMEGGGGRGEGERGGEGKNHVTHSKLASAAIPPPVSQFLGSFQQERSAVLLVLLCP